MDSFTKKATNVGGCIGIVIPYKVAYKEGIIQGSMIRVIVEKIPNKAVDGFYGTFAPDLAIHASAAFGAPWAALNGPEVPA